MKLYKKLIIGALACLPLASCNDYLDVNTNPNTPTSDNAIFNQRIPWMQFYMSHIYHIVATHTSFYCGDFYGTTAREKNAATWQLNGTNRANNAQQWFYTQVGVNYQDLYDEAMAAGAYHYAGLAKYFRAYGFMMLTDLFGEVPYTEAFGENASPKYDTGKTIFLGCVQDIDDAIDLLSRDQVAVDGVTPPTLAESDSWNGGDVQKWLKMCYLLKARWLNHLVKKEAGKYTDGKYDADEILACLEKAQQSNSDNTVIHHTDTNTSSHDVLGWNEPVDYSAVYSCVGMNANRYMTKTYYDNLTNFDNKGIEDPRADKFIPWVRSVKTASTPADIKWSSDGLWRRSMGIDLQSSLPAASRPVRSTFNATTQAWNNSNPEDTIYVELTAGSTGYAGGVDMLFRRNTKYDTSAMSGVFYDRATSPSYMATYAEANFIKAEVLFRKGEKNGAFTAFTTAVRASIDAVNEQLKTWVAEDASLASCPSFTPIEEADIDNFIDNALGSASDLTLGKIMTQKLLAMPFSGENWNDMRKCDYDPNIYMAWNIASYYYSNGTGLTYCPLGSYPRRYNQTTYEIQYNSRQLSAIGAEIPEAQALGDAWYSDNIVHTIPVWWDSDQE